MHISSLGLQVDLNGHAVVSKAPQNVVQQLINAITS